MNGLLWPYQTAYLSMELNPQQRALDKGSLGVPAVVSRAIPEPNLRGKFRGLARCSKGALQAARCPLTYCVSAGLLPYLTSPQSVCTYALDTRSSPFSYRRSCEQ